MYQPRSALKETAGAMDIAPWLLDPVADGTIDAHVLLSVAQFEREVTSERIRDKIAVSKRKWVGGMVPLGYILKEGQLHIQEEEANIVRLIFQRYLELGSVNRLVKDLKERGLKSKSGSWRQAEREERKPRRSATLQHPTYQYDHLPRLPCTDPGHSCR